MILVAPFAINCLQNGYIGSVKDDVISKLDEDMKKILQSNADDYDKWKMYEYKQVLQLAICSN